MKYTTKPILLASFFAFALLMIVSCSQSDAVESETEETGTLIQAVRVENLVPSDLRKFIELNGNIRAEKSMSVYPVVSGKITGSPVHLGSSVKKGDVLAYVDPSTPGSRYLLNKVLSPIDGTVISVPLKEGSRVDTETAVAVIGDLSKLQIITYIPERYVSFLKKGLDAELVLEAYPDEKFKATVSEVSPVLDEATRTKEVILNFANSDSRINAGMFAAINLYLKDFKNVYSVPTSCIIEKGGKKYVYVISDSEKSEDGKYSKVHFTEIKAGEEIVDRTIIEFASAEKIADKVVVQGFETLQDSALVNVAE